MQWISKIFNNFLNLRKYHCAHFTKKHFKDNKSKQVFHQCSKFKECGRALNKITCIQCKKICMGRMPFKFKKCVKAFNNFSTLYHSSDKPYGYKDCGKAFIQRSTLTKHNKNHAAEKPYCCKECGKAFITPQNLLSTRWFIVMSGHTNV